MKDITKTYSNEKITIVWKASLCIHSKKCWTSLPDVFKPREKPWIIPTGADTESIMKQIDLCPSGALTYHLNKEVVNAASSENKIEVTLNGPILVHGTIEIVHSDGKKEKKEKVTALCRCGASNNKPFCDGSHHKIEFKG